MKKLLLLVVLALLGAGLYRWAPGIGSAFSRPKNQEPEARFIATAEARDINYTIEVSGDVAPEVQLEVKSEVGGKVRKIHVVAGQQIRRGELLCEIDDTDLRSERASVLTQIEGAQLSVDRARLHFNRAKKLFKENLITREAYENISSDLAIAENGLARSQRQLQIVEDRISKTRIVSPTEGTLLSVAVVEGQVVIGAASVNSGTTLMMVADLSRLLLDTYVNQVDVARLEVGQKVTLRVESTKEQGVEGEIRFIAPVATVKNGVKGFQVKAAILNPGPHLRPGMTVNMSVPIARASDVLSVPVSAVFAEGGRQSAKRVVYVLGGQDAPPEPREVKLGVTSIDFAEIKEGLQPGERVLTVEPRMLTKKS